MEFGSRLKSMRKEHGYSQETFAEELGVSRQAVCKWENDKGYPEIDTLIVISQIFGVTVDYLLKGENTDSNSGSEEGYYVSSELVDGFLDYKHHMAKWIAIGVGLILLSSNLYVIQNEIIREIVTCLCLVCGVAMLIWQKFTPNNYRMLYKEELMFRESVIQTYEKRYHHNRRIYGVLIIIGVSFLLASDTIISLFMGYDFNEEYLSTFVMNFDIVAFVLFIFCGVSMNAETYIFNKMKGKEISVKSNKWIGVAIPITIFAVLLGLFFHTWSPMAPIIIFIGILLFDIYKHMSEAFL